ncbi:LysR family transcriptional regulator [Motiliproteus sp. MSK22-1]|uniref:LysR family transcriptional regulator n=1 Tax=Motiliproteus sp. MSK22-1 TaxID=1897630 RepID=UPI0009764B76|nr:LysR family transcriptional regulator [Motiliproteus sp. MSK22-1]OMH37958.1 hypothetical protein BGP75_06630 [Motiliproteus sp. MSK22-1]
MKHRQLAQLDFKLLLCLQQLLLTCNVSQAADQLHMSQPAMSRALNRLRELFDDPLFIRSNSGMQPTTRALTLAEPLSATLAQLDNLMQKERFEPGKSKRQFRLQMTGYMAQAYLAEITKKFYQQAPHADLETINLKEKSLLNQPASVADLTFCSDAMYVPDHYRRQQLGEEFFSCVMAQDHPLNSLDQLSVDDYLSYPHVITTLGGSPHIRVNDMLSKLGYQRRIGMRLPHYMAALEIVGSSHLLITSTTLVVERYKQQFGLSVKPLPINMEPATYYQVWSPVVHQDPALIWLRQLCAQIISEMIEKHKQSQNHKLS